MARRPRWIAIALGLVILLWGMASLQRIFVRERDDALASLEGRRQALEQFARRELEQMLRDDLAAAAFEEIEAAQRDPLAPADGLYLALGGRQVLPRPAAFAPGDETPAKALYEALVAGRFPEPDEPEDPFAERLALLRRFRAAVERDDVRGIEEIFRATLTHRARFVIPAARDVPFTMALVEFFLAKSTPDRDLMRALVRDGLGPEMPGLQRVLLERRARFTRRDFEFLARRLVELSAKVEARHDDFEQEAFGEPEAAPSIPDPLDRPMLVADRTWYVERVEEGRVEGIAVELPALLDAITVEMRDRALMGPGDRIALLEPASGPEPLAALPLRADSPEWASARAAVASRYRLKSALGLALGALAAGVAGLVLLLQARERRFLALKSDFVATVSHELRTPLAAVRLLAETLEKKVGGHAEARDYPRRIVQEVDALSFLVENILSFNRLEKGKVTPRKSGVRLAEMVDLVRTEAPLRSAAPVNLTASGVEDAVVEADPELLKLLFLNLASNACKHNKRAPVEIGIAARNGGGSVVVEFRDNGVGIPEADRERVFEEFFRAATPSGARGFGLGLAICRRIMQLHGGEIRVAESSVDGTRFELVFPAGARAGGDGAATEVAA